MFRRPGAVLLLAFHGLACAAPPVVPPGAPALRYFGYALVDCGVDDPNDDATTTNHVAEVAAFSNVAQMCVFQPGDDIRERLRLMSRHGVKALLSVQAIFFAGRRDATQGSGMKFELHPDHQARWSAFIKTNRLVQDHANIAAFYLVDEPVWNGVSAADLKQAADAVKASFPTVPIALIEAPAGLKTLEVPASVDWIGFDHYAIPRPDTDPVFQSELALLKSRRSHAAQKILLVMDAQWLPFYGEAGYQPAYMATVATSYYTLAQADPDVIGIVGYLWPGGFDNPRQKGMRQLPRSVLEEHMRIGKLISGK
jgi:hypothetical protein